MKTKGQEAINRVEKSRKKQVEKYENYKPWIYE